MEVLQGRFLVRGYSLAEARSYGSYCTLQERFLNRELAYDHAACLSDSISEPSSAAFGLTSQNFGRNVR